MKLKSLLEMAGVAHLPKARAIIQLDEGFKEAQNEFAQASSPDEAQQRIAQFRELVNRNQVQGDDRNIDLWRKKGWEAFSKYVADKSQQKSKTQEKRSKTSGNAITLKEDDRWLIVAPLDKEASCFHGKGSDWCTTKPAQSYFEDYYYEKGVTLIYCLEKDTGGMWAIAATPKVDRLEMFDKKDKPISEEVFLEQTGLNPRDLVAIAHRPDNLARIEESKRAYVEAKSAIDRLLDGPINERNQELEQSLMFVKDPASTIEYISKLYVANDKRPINVPGLLVIIATKSDLIALRMVTDVSESSLRTIVRNDARALRYLANPSERIQLDAMERDPMNYTLIRNPSVKTSWMYIASIMHNTGVYIVDLPGELQGMLTNATPDFQRMMIEGGSFAIRFVENPTDETKQAVMVDDKFAAIRDKLATKWKIEPNVIDLYKADAQAIEVDMRSSEQIWNVIDNDTSKITQSTVDQLNRLADLYTDRSYRHYIKLNGASTANQHQDIINRLRQFTQTWDKKLDQYQNIVNQK